ncbi:hypothetical protein QVD99_002874 [Batrachochytrium dendrobatidis]|nr:hypothetical protein QVD99_002874 [Batrachochytrium dendrobatidis]
MSPVSLTEMFIKGLDVPPVHSIRTYESEPQASSMTQCNTRSSADIRNMQYE